MQKFLNQNFVKTITTLLVIVLAFVLLIYLWESVVTTQDIPKRILPKPSDIYTYLNKDFFGEHRQGYQSLFEKSLQSFGDGLIGFGLAIIIGCSVAVLFAEKEIFKISISPFVFITQLLPVPAFAPIVAALLGYGSETKILIITLFLVFPVIVSTEKAILAIPENYLSLFKVYNASKRKKLFLLTIPAIIPNFFTMLKVLCTASLITSILAELPLNVSSGIGKDIYNSFNNQITTRVWSSLLIISLISLTFFILINYLEKYISATYHYGIKE